MESDKKLALREKSGRELLGEFGVGEVLEERWKMEHEETEVDGRIAEFERKLKEKTGVKGISLMAIKCKRSKL
jgi:hypothetical protein